MSTHPKGEELCKELQVQAPALHLPQLEQMHQQEKDQQQELAVL